MKRKHMPGCYCCNGCYIIPDEELPTITIPGFTFTAWGTVGGEGMTGGLCCRCAFFSPNNTEYTEICSDYFAETTLEQVTSWILKGARPPVPKAACFGSTIETTIDNLCHEFGIDIASHTVEDTQSQKWKLFTRYRPGVLRVCISKQLVTCGDDEPVEKWVILSVYQYELVAYMQSEISRSLSSQSELFHPCFFVNENRDSCDDTCSEQIGDACDDPFSSFPVVSEIVEFFRVKLFDDLPVGDVIFDNTAKPTDCDWDFCEDPSEFFDQFCISISSWPTAVYNCQCEETLNDPLFCEITYSNCFACGCDCPDFLGNGYLWQFWTNECVIISHCDQPCQNFDCGTHVRIEICSPGAIVGPTSEPCSGRWLTDVFNWGPRNLCQEFTGPGFGNVFNGSFSCWSSVSCEGESCSEDCCYSLDCGDCKPCLGPKVIMNYDEITGFSRDWTCELTPTSFCLNAPTWTATFA